jgi:hypothetical protein
MGHYRIYRLDPSDHVTAGFSVECGSDAAALRAARALLELEQSAGVEDWKSANRLAHLSLRGPAALGSAAEPQIVACPWVELASSEFLGGAVAVFFERGSHR